MRYFVYCLYQKDEIIYIGSSTKLLNRLITHKKDKDFDKVVYCELNDRQTMLDFEIYYIDKVKPRLNRILPLPTMTEPLKDIKWIKANLSFLYKDKVDLYRIMEQNIWLEYLDLVCEKLSISNIDPYSEWGLTYIKVGCKTAAVFDGSGLSLESLALNEGVIGYSDYKNMRYENEGVISLDEYNWSLEQFD